MKTEKNKTEVAILAGGCFWCVEAIYLNLKGVEKVRSGYIGGNTSKPNYEQVSSGLTGHAEAVEIVYDPNIVSYETILDIFFASHDPTTLNKQGYDVGTQYRSEIFYLNEEQKNIAEKKIKQLETEAHFNSPIVTKISKATSFYVAENYHQNYYNQNQNQAYCKGIITPKLNKFKTKFKNHVKN